MLKEQGVLVRGSRFLLPVDVVIAGNRNDPLRRDEVHLVQQLHESGEATRVVPASDVAAKGCRISPARDPQALSPRLISFDGGSQAVRRLWRLADFADGVATDLRDSLAGLRASP
jgi:hypothetical protein